MKKNEQNLKDLQNTIKHNLQMMGVKKERRDKKGQKEYLKKC